MISRVNYFLYHIRLNTKIGTKLETSLAYLQLEIGLCQPFLTASYEMYGELATTTLLKCIWAETDPFGITLRPNKTSIWIPHPQGPTDMSIMAKVRAIYNPSDCVIINRVRLYLQLITIYDLITYDGKQIHSEIFQGRRVSSRISPIYWVPLFQSMETILDRSHTVLTNNNGTKMGHHGTSTLLYMFPLFH
jgi:hypothetical protein